jgi:hypothetical protein
VVAQKLFSTFPRNTWAAKPANQAGNSPCNSFFWFLQDLNTPSLLQKVFEGFAGLILITDNLDLCHHEVNSCKSCTKDFIFAQTGGRRKRGTETTAADIAVTRNLL